MRSFGPPPRRPPEPHYVQTTHVLHFLITFLTCGLWALVWIVVTLQHRSYNARAFQAHQQAMAQWEYDMWLWEEARRGPA